MNEQGRFAAEARGLGKSARTRAKLMDAAVSIFARDGFESASVNEIARAADVVNGTFYVHFKDKKDIAAAVTYRIADDVTKQLDDAMKDIDDGAERTSCATRRFIDFACAQPEWGRALFRAVWYFREIRDDVVRFLRADLQRGHRQGVFTVPIDNFVVEIFAGMVMSALINRIDGKAGPDAGSKVAELQLRMLGVPPKRAKAVAWKKLPPFEVGPPSQRANDGARAGRFGTGAQDV